MVAAGVNPMSLKRGIDAATQHVVQHLERGAKALTTTEEIEQVATVSANDDKIIGGLIATAMQRVTKGSCSC
jgi:chaperonin GroEL